MKLIREHDGLKNMVVAIIDINEPKMTDGSVKILTDLAALDALISDTHNQQQLH